MLNIVESGSGDLIGHTLAVNSYHIGRIVGVDTTTDPPIKMVLINDQRSPIRYGKIIEDWGTSEGSKANSIKVNPCDPLGQNVKTDVSLTISLKFPHNLYGTTITLSDRYKSLKAGMVVGYLPEITAWTGSIHDPFNSDGTLLPFFEEDADDVKVSVDGTDTGGYLNAKLKADEDDALHWIQKEIVQTGTDDSGAPIKHLKITHLGPNSYADSINGKSGEKFTLIEPDPSDATKLVIKELSFDARGHYTWEGNWIPLDIVDKKVSANGSDAPGYLLNKLYSSDVWIDVSDGGGFASLTHLPPDAASAASTTPLQIAAGDDWLSVNGQAGGQRFVELCLGSERRKTQTIAHMIGGRSAGVILQHLVCESRIKIPSEFTKLFYRCQSGQTCPNIIRRRAKQAACPLCDHLNNRFGCSRLGHFTKIGSA